MAESGAVLVQRLLDLAETLRDRVNEPRRHQALRRRGHEVWNSICSAMDVVSDTSAALLAYCETASSGQELSKGATYLLAYGVLHTLYLQQDAAFWWGSSLGLAEFTSPPYKDSPGKWALSVPELAAARKVRNDTTGHPVRRDRRGNEPVSSFFIVQHSLSVHGFQFIQHDERGGTSWPFEFVSFRALIEGQTEALTRVFRDALVALDSADRHHYEKFMNRPLTDILQRFNHSLEKLGSSEGADRLLVRGFAEHIERGLQELKDAIIERDEPFDEQWQWEYRKLATALSGLSHYSRSAESESDLADVFGDYVRYAIGHLMELTRELDERYEGSSPGRAALNGGAT